MNSDGIEWMPTQVMVGKKKWSVHTLASAGDFGGRHMVLGSVAYGVRAIVVSYAQPAASMRETFWHELTHAILHDMKSPLRSDEKFVTAFSKRLSRAIDTAKFE